MHYLWNLWRRTFTASSLEHRASWMTKQVFHRNLNSFSWWCLMVSMLSCCLNDKMGKPVFVSIFNILTTKPFIFCLALRTEDKVKPQRDYKTHKLWTIFFVEFLFLIETLNALSSWVISNNIDIWPGLTNFEWCLLTILAQCQRSSKWKIPFESRMTLSFWINNNRFNKKKKMFHLLVDRT